MGLSANPQAAGVRKAARARIWWRFGLLGATAGLLAGIWEAGVHHIVPLVPTIPVFEVNYVIWFLAPLLGLTLFGLLGATLGLLAEWWAGGHPWRAAALAAVVVAAAVAYAASALVLAHAEGGFRGTLRSPTPWIWFAGALAALLLGMRLARGRIHRAFVPEAQWPMRFWVTTVALAAAAAALGLAWYVARRPTSTSASPPPQAARRRSPNVVLITLDTVRADHLSAYGYSRPTTPNLDRLARRGVLFENAIAPSAWTLPTLASLFTGLLPHQHGADWHAPLDNGFWTLAEVLHSRGYETASFNANREVGLKGWGLEQGFDVYLDDSSAVRRNLTATLVGRALIKPLHRRLGYDSQLDGRLAPQVNQEVFRWFRRRSDRPFFLYVNYIDAHDLSQPPAPFTTRMGRISNALVRRVSSMDARDVPNALTGEEMAALIDTYDNWLAFLDSQVGELFEFLAQSPDWSNTIVIVTSDHGEAFGEHSTYAHGYNLYREALHVPLMLAGPGIPATLRIPHAVGLRGLFATVLDLTLYPRPPFSRASLRRFWTPGFVPEPHDQAVVSELIPDIPGFRPAMIGVMTAEWHYLHSSDGRSELYYLPDDSGEKVNLAESPDHQVVLRTLHQKLEAYVGSSLKPWRGPQYLLALDRPGYSFLRQAIFAPKSRQGSAPVGLPVGSSQAFFSSAPSGLARPQPEDEELIESLPYH